MENWNYKVPLQNKKNNQINKQLFQINEDAWKMSLVAFEDITHQILEQKPPHRAAGPASPMQKLQVHPNGPATSLQYENLAYISLHANHNSTWMG